jgi:hypothetical protein
VEIVRTLTINMEMLLSFLLSTDKNSHFNAGMNYNPEDDISSDEEEQVVITAQTEEELLGDGEEVMEVDGLNTSLLQPPPPPPPPPTPKTAARTAARTVHNLDGCAVSKVKSVGSFEINDDSRVFDAHYWHCYNKKINISSSFDLNSMTCKTCTFRGEHTVLGRNGGGGGSKCTPLGPCLLHFE